MAAPSEPVAPPRIRYFDKDAISEHLICPICQEIFNYPIALTCSHVFCDGCIREWLKHQRTCPECRQSVDLHSSHKDLIAHKFLDSVPVYCSYLGCSWIGRMDALQGHMSDCECNPAKLPEFMVAKEPVEVAAEGTDMGTTSLRMKLFKGASRELLNNVASGDMNIFSTSAVSSNEPRVRVSDLTADLVRTSDIVNRNRAPADATGFIDLEDIDD